MEASEKLMEKLAGDCMERLRWVVCRRLGILPGTPGWRFMSARRVLKYACHMALDARENGARMPGAQRESGSAAEFDMERFRALGGSL